MKVCKINGCKDKIVARGWCNKHYKRWKRYDDPLFTKNHGHSKDPLYTVWTDMKTRCYNKNYKQYKDYGGRGITVCSKWMDDSKAFIEWALPLWKEGLLIDRTDNDGNYCPENCEFVTHAESQLHQRLLRSHNTSGYRGVSYRKDRKKWEAEIRNNNKHKHLGLFNTAIEAAQAYNTAVSDSRPKNII